jgi:O-acetylserine/cysteine efflux transporter
LSVKDGLLAVLIILSWAVNLLIAKLGVESIPPLLLATLRFAMVAAILVPFVRVSRVQLPALAAISFALSTVHFGIMFAALRLSEAGTGALLIQLGAPLLIVMSAVVLKEPFNRWTLLGMALAVIGLFCLVIGPTAPPLLATGLFLLSATGWASGNLLIRLNPDIGPFAVTAWSSLLGVPQTGALSWFLESRHPGDLLSAAALAGWISVLYSAVIASVISYSLWYRLLRKYPVSGMASLSLLNPVFTLALAVMFLGETLTFSKLIGGGLILCRIFLGIRNAQKRPKRSGSVYVSTGENALSATEAFSVPGGPRHPRATDAGG